MERHITLPLTREEARTIKSGEQLLLSGVIYTARDAAHKRLCELVEKGEPLPFDVKNATIYYVGPTPAKPGQVIGSAGPTTSYRMDAYSPTLIREGETGMIGKGKRNADEFYAELENEMLRKVNALGIGPQGFGGKTTALAVNIEAMPTHIAGLPVAVNINCHVTRHKSAII